MRYCSADDVKNRIPVMDVAALTDSIGTQTTDQVIESAIDAVCAVIDGYVRNIINLPLSTVPALIKELSIRLSIHRLYANSQNVIITDSMVKLHEEDMKLLSDIQRGLVTIITTATTATTGYLCSHTAANEIFSQTTLDKY